MPGIIKLTSTVNLTERWGLDETSGLTAPAQLNTPANDMVLTNAGWGVDSNGRYWQPAIASDRGVALNNVGPGFGAANHDFSIDICVLEYTSALGTNIQLFSGGDNIGSSPNLPYFFAKITGTGFYRPLVNGPSGATDDVTTIPFVTGLTYFLLTWSISTGTLKWYINGVLQNTLTTGFDNYTIQQMVLANYQNMAFPQAFLSPVYFHSIYFAELTANTALNNWGIINGGANPTLLSNAGVLSTGLEIGLNYFLHGLATSMLPNGSNAITGYIVNINGTDHACNATNTGSGSIIITTPQIFTGDVVTIRYPTGNGTDNYFFTATPFTAISLVNNSIVSNSPTNYGANFTTASLLADVSLPTPFRQTLHVGPSPSGQNLPRRLSVKR